VGTSRDFTFDAGILSFAEQKEGARGKTGMIELTEKQIAAVMGGSAPEPLASSGMNTNMAINGSGMFIVDKQQATVAPSS
jgi:hypothetical protein